VGLLKAQTEIRDKKAALGFRAHSGWAVLVVLAGPIEAPIVVERRRIDIADPKIAGSKQPYHAAERLNLKDAETLVSACTEASVQFATKAVGEAIADAKQKGYEISTSCILTGSGRSIPALDKILASHPLLHTAEGELFRNVIARACLNHGLPVVAVKEKELIARAQKDIGISGELIDQHLQRMGKTIGVPWRQDEKHASLAAWIARSAESS
jgi:hypothetical protein